MTNEMIKELDVMGLHGIIRLTKAAKAISYIKLADAAEIEEFESMSVTEAVDYVLEIV